MRLFMTLAGVAICSSSVGIFNLAAFGVDPFQCFAQGSYLPFLKYMDYGTFYLAVSLILLAGIFVWDRHFIGIATFINMFFTGYLADYSYRFLVSVFPSVSLIQRIFMLGAALILMCLGSSLYYTADLGVSVYDAVALILAKKKMRVGDHVVPFKWIRVTSDFVCIALGAAFGKKPGIGTVITGFFMGPLIAVFNQRISEPLRYGRVR